MSNKASLVFSSLAVAIAIGSISISVAVKGPKGEPGPAGEIGLTGDKGETGDPGTKGENGDKGPTGEVGDKGPQGDRGQQGQPGEKGENGSKGPQGEQGNQGPAGDAGLKGDPGIKGPEGEKGPTGEKGETGAKGEPGIKGETGEAGVIGPEGDQGQKGPTGNKGPNGERGPEGNKGPTGPQGNPGIKGETGPEGNKGQDGPQGNPGEKGETGQQGLPGNKGEQGKSAYQIYLEANPGSEETYPTEELWLEALLSGNLIEKPAYTVHFNTGTGTPIPDQTIKRGEKVEKPTDPLKTGYTFKKWTCNGENWSMIGSPVTEEITLDAVYEINTYDVKFIYDNGTPAKTIKYEYNSIINQDNPEHADKFFKNWTDETGNVVTFPYELEDKNKIFTANYDDAVKIYFDTNGGDLIDPIKLYTNTTYSETLPTPIRANSNFEGWYLDGVKVDGPIQLTTNDVTLVASYTATEGLYTYSVGSNKEAEIIKYNGTENEVTIPDEFNGAKVTKIKDNAFSDNQSIQSVTFSPNIVEIGANVFENCSLLTKLDLKNTSKIGINMLSNTTISELTMLDFYSLVDLFGSNAAIPASLKLSITTNDSRPRANQTVFNGVSDKTLDLTISTTTLNYPKQYVSEISNVVERLTIAVCNSYQERKIALASKMKGLKYVTFKEGVTSTGDMTLQGCTDLLEVYLPTSLRTIGDYAFADCPKLYYCDLPDTITQIWPYAFTNCTSLESVKIPGACDSIDEFCFSGCTGLTKVYIPYTCTAIYSGAFENCTSLKLVILPKKLWVYETKYPEYLPFAGCTALEVVETSQSEEEFSRFSSATDLPPIAAYNRPIDTDFMSFSSDKNKILYYTTFSTSRPELDNSYLVANNDLTRTELDLETIGIGLNFIGIYSKACMNSTNLEKLVLPSTLKFIGAQAFDGCTKIDGVNIPEGVTRIDDLAFNACTGLKSIVIPKTLTKLGENVFNSIDLSQVTITYNGTKESFEQIDFGASNEALKTANIIFLNN